MPRDTQHSAVAPLPERRPSGRSAPAARPAGRGCRGERRPQSRARGILLLNELAQHRQLQRRPSPPSLIFWAAFWDACSSGGAPNPSLSLDPPSPSCRGSGSQELGNGDCSRPEGSPQEDRVGRAYVGWGPPLTPPSLLPRIHTQQAPSNVPDTWRPFASCFSCLKCQARHHPAGSTPSPLDCLLSSEVSYSDSSVYHRNSRSPHCLRGALGNMAPRGQGLKMRGHQPRAPHPEWNLANVYGINWDGGGVGEDS